SVYQALPALDQWQGGTLQPHPWPRNGLMLTPTTVTKPAPRHMLTGCTTIITTDPTLASQAQRLQTAFTTSQGITDRRSLGRHENRSSWSHRYLRNKNLSVLDRRRSRSC